PRILLAPKQTEESHLPMGLRTCSRHDERRYALRLLRTLLQATMSSRLFPVIRGERGLPYSSYTPPGVSAGTGDLGISAGLDTDNIAKALRLILVELRRLIHLPPSPAELRRARDYVIGQMDLSLENTDNQMNWLGEQWLGYGRVFTPGEIRR